MIQDRVVFLSVHQCVRCTCSSSPNAQLNVTVCKFCQEVCTPSTRGVSKIGEKTEKPGLLFMPFGCDTQEAIHSMQRRIRQPDREDSPDLSSSRQRMCTYMARCSPALPSYSSDGTVNLRDADCGPKAYAALLHLASLPLSNPTYPSIL